MTKQKDLTGTTIKIKKEHLKSIKISIEIINKADIIMEKGAEMKKKGNEELWAILQKLYPIIKDYQCSFGGTEINIRYKNGDIKAAREDARKRGLSYE